MIREFENNRRISFGLALVADVEVLGLAPHHQVAHAAAHQIGEIAGAVEPVQDLDGVVVDVAAGDGMLGALQNARLPLGFRSNCLSGRILVNHRWAAICRVRKGL